MKDKSDKIKCPECKKTYDREKFNPKYNKKYGREGVCPNKKCGKRLYLPTYARAFIPQKDGSFRKRFRNA